MRVSGQPVGPPVRRRRSRGFTIIEVFSAAALMVLTALSMVCAFGSSSKNSLDADRSLAVQASLENVMESFGEIPFEQLRSINGSTLPFPDRGHTVAVAANGVDIGLVLLELTVTDDETDSVVGRLATFRAGGH